MYESVLRKSFDCFIFIFYLLLFKIWWRDWERVKIYISYIIGTKSLIIKPILSFGCLNWIIINFSSLIKIIILLQKYKNKHSPLSSIDQIHILYRHIKVQTDLNYIDHLHLIDIFHRSKYQTVLLIIVNLFCNLSN